jgi:hypothetical protein
MNIQTAVANLLPTPQARDGDGRGTSDPDKLRGLNPKRTPMLDEVAVHKLLPSPRATDGTNGGPN